VAMFRGRNDPGNSTGQSQALWKIIAEGLVVGVVTGLVGAGGGFLVVPALRRGFAGFVLVMACFVLYQQI